MHEPTIRVEADGSLVLIYSDEHAALLDAGETTITRASHVEPAAGGWTADMSPVGGPLLGPFKLRADALDAEVAWLTCHVLAA